MKVEAIALISDLHGNLPALTAVLADIDQRGITRIICLGDLAGKGPDGPAVIDSARARCEAVVRGNWDEALAGPVGGDDWFAWHQRQLGDERRAYLGGLPNAVEFWLSGQGVRLLHASPVSATHRVQARADVETLRAMFANTPFTGDAMQPTIVGYGDIHHPFLRTLRNGTLFNVGSVGNPLDVPLAAYGILRGTPGVALAPFDVTIVRVPYDIERAIADAVAAGMPKLRPYEVELRTAAYQAGRE